MVGRKTEKNRLERNIGKVQETMRRIRHEPVEIQAAKVTKYCKDTMHITVEMYKQNEKQE